MKKLLLCAFLLTCGAAFASVKTPAQIESEINNQIMTNGQGAITGPVLNGILYDIAQSYFPSNAPQTWYQQQTFFLNPILPNCTGYLLGNGAAPATCSTSPQFASLALGGAALGANVLVANGTVAFTGGVIGSNYGAGTGTGLMGIGARPEPGVGLLVAPPAQNLLAGEILALNVQAHNTPTSTVIPLTGLYGAVLNARWDGSVDNSANAIMEGSQNEALITGSASLQVAYGTESGVIMISSGALVIAYGAYSHVENEGTGTITNAYGEYVDVGNSGVITNATGLGIGNVKGTNVIGLNILDQTLGTSNYAIKTGLGPVSFGDELFAPSANIPQLYGNITISSGGGASGGLTIANNVGDGNNLLILKHAGATVFTIDGNGAVTLASNLNLTTNYIVFASSTMIIGGNTITTNSSGVYQFTGSSNFYTTVDTGLSRVGPGVVCVGNQSAGDCSGTLKATSLITNPLTYATLPSAPTAGQRAYITDANTTTPYATVSSGGGSSKISVLYNGSNWVVD
jgi:hypothetical protein